MYQTNTRHVYTCLNNSVNSSPFSPFFPIFQFFYIYYSFFTFWTCFDLPLTIMMQFDTIVSILVKHDVICFKLGKRHKLFAENSDVVIPWTALASWQSKRKNCQKKLLFGTSGNSGGDRGYRGVPKSIPRGIGGWRTAGNIRFPGFSMASLFVDPWGIFLAKWKWFDPKVPPWIGCLFYYTNVKHFNLLYQVFRKKVTNCKTPLCLVNVAVRCRRRARRTDVGVAHCSYTVEAHYVQT